FGKPLGQWIKALEDKNPLVREEALAVLADLGPAAKEAAPAVAGLLKDPRPFVRLHAAVALWKVTRQPDEAGPGPPQARRRPPPRPAPRGPRGPAPPRGPAAGRLTPALLDALPDADAEQSALLTQALYQFGDTPALVKALGHKDPAVRRTVCEVLGWLPG